MLPIRRGAFPRIATPISLFDRASGRVRESLLGYLARD